MAHLFSLILIQADGYSKVQTRADIDNERQQLCDAVAQLHAAADRLCLFSPPDAQIIKERANAIAAEIDRRYELGLGVTPKALIVERERADPSLKAFVIEATQACRCCFDSPLSSTVATLANVCLNRNDIDRQRVRDLVP